MLCPQCKTDNRPDRGECYNCGQDLGTLRRVVGRARNLYNSALEHAERDRAADAIADLKNALELDSSFIDAWVVLGTVYARQEQYGEAEQAWHRALALDGRLEKAHGYLLKTKGIIPALPALRNVRIIAVVLTALLAACVGALIVQARPDPAMRKVIHALDLHKEGKTAEALAALDEGATIGVASPKAKRVARAFQVQLLAGLDSDIDAIETLVRNGRLEACVRKIDAVAALSPPEEIERKLANFRAEVGAQALALARADKSAFDEGTLGYAELKTRLDHLENLTKGGAAGADIAALRTEAGKHHSHATLATVRNRIMAAEDIREAARRSNQLTAENPGMAEEIDAIFVGRLAAEADARVLAARDHLAAGKPGPARRISREVASLFEELGKPRPGKLLGELGREILEVESESRLATLVAARDGGRYEAMLGILDEADPNAWTSRDAKRASTLREEAERAIAEATWRWSSTDEMDRKFEDVKISQGDARRMIDYYELVIRYAPDEERAYRTTRALFRTASAHKMLGETAKAKDFMRRLKSEYPDSKLLGYPAVRKFEARLENADYSDSRK